MPEVKERIKELVDKLDPQVAIEVEQLLSRLALGREHADWLEFSAVSFGQFFDDSEVEYTEDDLPEGA